MRGVITLAAAVAMFLATVFAAKAWSHDIYLGKRDPVTKQICCSTSANESYGDCGVLRVTKTNLRAEADGYYVDLTLDDARKINPMVQTEVHIFVPFERVQASEDGNYHICFGRFGQLYCFMAPGSI